MSHNTNYVIKIRFVGTVLNNVAPYIIRLMSQMYCEQCGKAIFTLSMDGKNGLSGMLSGECSQDTTTTNKTGINLEVMMLIVY